MTISTSLQDMCSFLESLFVDFGDGTGCLRESPNVEKDRCYLNTNFIALEVLKMCNSAKVSAIEAFLSQYDSVLYDDKNRLRILLYKDIPLPPQSVTRQSLGSKTTINNETIYIYVDVLSGNVFEEWLDYADHIILVALQELKNENFEWAWRYRGYAQRMWVQIGFADKPYYNSGLFETYKLSLYYYLMRTLRYRDDIVAWIENNIDKFINNGGVITHYDNNLTPQGDPNVESTTITALAFYSDYPDRFPLYIRGSYVSPWKPLETAITVIAGFGTGITLAKIASKIMEKIKRG